MKNQLIGHAGILADMLIRPADVYGHAEITFRKEVCRLVPGWIDVWVPRHGAYLVSGRGKNRVRLRILNLGSNHQGYRFYFASGAGKRRRLFLHHAVLLAWVGPRLGLIGRHLDGNKLNNHTDNLAWGTYLENAQDRVKHGVSARGEKHGRSKMTEEFVLNLRRLAASGIRLNKLAELYPQFSKGALNRASNGQAWKHLPNAVKRRWVFSTQKYEQLIAS